MSLRTRSASWLNMIGRTVIMLGECKYLLDFMANTTGISNHSDILLLRAHPANAPKRFLHWNIQPMALSVNG